MTIWLLAILLLVCLAAVGYQQGAIRAGISFFGILLAALLAGLLGKLVGPLLKLLGVVNPILLWALPPFIAFVVLLALIKIGALLVHQKVDVYYKYKAGDLRLKLWERLNARLGACVGLMNGVVYMILIAMVIHAFSYWTVQMASGATDPRGMRILNQLGRDLQSTGMTRVAKAVDPMPDAFYETADLAGLLYQNPMLEARFLRYPGFLSLGERPEFQTLGQDSAFAEMRLKQAPLREVLNHPTAMAVFDNPELLRLVWATVQPDVQDLGKFLETGKSAKYDGEPILGRWRFDPNMSILVYRRSKPNATASEAAKLRGWMNEKFPKSSIVAGPDHMVVLKGFPLIRLQPGQPFSGEAKNLKGDWRAGSGDYEITLEGGTDKRTAKFDGNRLIISGDGTPVAYIKED
ncbi:MAG: CvpA family protein [Verrucomicrobiota bacterium]|nr:CvpA family protein [Verrucomicrobiota bacterium]MCC6819141.1 CvpA family protein [Limisphaerales bacterium]